MFASVPQISLRDLIFEAKLLFHSNWYIYTIFTIEDIIIDDPLIIGQTI